MYRAIFIALTTLLITSVSDTHAAPKGQEVPVQASVGINSNVVVIPPQEGEAGAVVYTVPPNKFLIIDDAQEICEVKMALFPLIPLEQHSQCTS